MPRQKRDAAPELRSKVAERLAMLRGDRSQRQFAKDLGVPQQNVNRYERGTLPTLEFLPLLHAAGVDLNWLVTGEGAAFRRKARGMKVAA